MIPISAGEITIFVPTGPGETATFMPTAIGKTMMPITTITGNTAQIPTHTIDSISCNCVGINHPILFIIMVLCPMVLTFIFLISGILAMFFSSAKTSIFLSNITLIFLGLSIFGFIFWKSIEFISIIL